MNIPESFEEANIMLADVALGSEDLQTLEEYLSTILAEHITDDAVSAQMAISIAGLAYQAGRALQSDLEENRPIMMPMDPEMLVSFIQYLVQQGPGAN